MLAGEVFASLLAIPRVCDVLLRLGSILFVPTASQSGTAQITFFNQLITLHFEYELGTFVISRLRVRISLIQLVSMLGTLHPFGIGRTLLSIYFGEKENLLTGNRNDILMLCPTSILTRARDLSPLSRRSNDT